ncbi:MAG: sigma 54-dependent Fis family transcriptional regulator [Sandaracinaceae bacterium]|nr:sigma 54-dependent Fis family transcriptional regulator [Sandaracinaceae bacterium]
MAERGGETDRTMSTPGRRATGWRTQRVIVVQSPDATAVGRAVLLDEQALTIGRAGHVDGPLALSDGELSRRHAALEREPATDTWWLRDLSSRNGTFVNGAPEARAGLLDQDVIRVGATLLVFEKVELGPDAALSPAEEAPLFGQSVAMQRTRGEVARVAGRDMPVLVLGESGSGKELVARALHERSGRTGALVAVNCGALPPDLVESELFGHVAGAFTGAAKPSEGLFVAASGGTIFLDEIGEMPLAVQPKLLRALATGEIRPVGASQARQVDARVVAATNRDLGAEVSAESFRGDLYARLAGWTIQVPPLRQRKEDVLRLARRFLERHEAPTRVEPDAVEALLLHRWPFNVRELEQLCAAIAVRATDADEVLLDHLPPAIAAPIAARRPMGLPSEPPLSLSVRPEATPTADELAHALRHFGGNVAHVATFFGRDRRQIYRWIERYGLDVDALRD